MEVNIDIRVINLLMNDEFIHYVIDPTPSFNEKWNDYFCENPELIPASKIASQIILGKFDQKTLPIQENLEIKSRIFEKCGLCSLN